jgi:hypothetical protein
VSAIMYSSLARRARGDKSTRGGATVVVAVSLTLAALCLTLTLPRALAVGTERQDGSWSLPLKVCGTSGRSELLHIAVGGDGSLHVAWQEGDPTQVFYATSRPPWDEWSEPLDVGLGYASAIAVDAAGAVHVAWAARSPISGIVDAVKPPPGGWTAPSVVAPEPPLAQTNRRASGMATSP